MKMIIKNNEIDGNADLKMIIVLKMYPIIMNKTYIPIKQYNASKYIYIYIYFVDFKYLCKI